MHSHNYSREELHVVTFDMKLGPEVVKAEVIIWSHCNRDFVCMLVRTTYLTNMYIITSTHKNSLN